MTSSTEELVKLKQDREALQRKIDKARGALDQTLKQIEEEFGFKTLEEAAEELDILQEEATSAKEEFENELGKYRERWAERL